VRIATCALTLLLTGSGAVSAQDTPANITNTTLDTSVPESPAFTVLGLTSTTVTRPSTPRGLASALSSGFDTNGNFQSGLAIDTAPYMLFYGNQVSLELFQTNPLVRILARTQVSVASVKGTSDADKSAKLAVGFNLTIFDKGDPRGDKDYLKGLAALAVTTLNTLPALPPTATAEQILARKDLVTNQVEKAAKPLREEYKKKSWNRSSWVIAAAPSWISKDGTTSQLEANGFAAWTSLAYGFESVPGLKDNAQLILHGRFRSNESVPDPLNVGKFYQQKSTVAGASLRFGTANTIGSFEAAFVDARPTDRPNSDTLRITLAGEEQLADNVWLHFSVGGGSGESNGQNKLFILGAFKWAIGPK
jgi:hypothetical protein